jgi:hypothetical protein
MILTPRFESDDSMWRNEKTREHVRIQCKFKCDNEEWAHIEHAFPLHWDLHAHCMCALYNWVSVAKCHSDIRHISMPLDSSFSDHWFIEISDVCWHIVFQSRCFDFAVAGWVVLAHQEVKCRRVALSIVEVQWRIRIMNLWNQKIQNWVQFGTKLGDVDRLWFQKLFLIFPSISFENQWISMKFVVLNGSGPPYIASVRVCSHLPERMLSVDAPGVQVYHHWNAACFQIPASFHWGNCFLEMDSETLVDVSMQWPHSRENMHSMHWYLFLFFICYFQLHFMPGWYWGRLVDWRTCWSDGSGSGYQVLCDAVYLVRFSKCIVLGDIL